jgi:hypothetical protein
MDDGESGRVEPHSLRDTQDANLILFVCPTPRTVRSYRVDRVAGIRPTSAAFQPKFPSGVLSSPRSVPQTHGAAPSSNRPFLSSVADEVRKARSGKTPKDTPERSERVALSGAQVRSACLTRGRWRPFPIDDDQVP